MAYEVSKFSLSCFPLLMLLSVHLLPHCPSFSPLQPHWPPAYFCIVPLHMHAILLSWRAFPTDSQKSHYVTTYEIDTHPVLLTFLPHWIFRHNIYHHLTCINLKIFLLSVFPHWSGSVTRQRLILSLYCRAPSAYAWVWHLVSARYWFIR